MAKDNLKLNAKKIIQKLTHNTESIIECIIFYSRWILSPMYIILMLVLILILGKFIGNVWHFIQIMWTLTDDGWIVHILELIDLTLMANLVVFVAFSGYEIIISNMEVADRSKDKLKWMGKIDFSDLKLKIIGSIVAISIIELLQDFLNAPYFLDANVEFWRIILHLTFVVTGVVFALMEIISQKRSEIKDKGEQSELIEL